jgi:uncharacterized protein (DUF2461 family)
MGTIFFKPKHKALAKKISIESPVAFRKSVAELKKKGLTLMEKRALILARTRAKIMLKRKNLSEKERMEMGEISEIKI